MCRNKKYFLIIKYMKINRIVRMHKGNTMGMRRLVNRGYISICITIGMAHTKWWREKYYGLQKRKGI